MNYFVKYSTVMFSFSIVLLIFLHFNLRDAEHQDPNITVTGDYFTAPINYATGSGFSDCRYYTNDAKSFYDKGPYEPNFRSLSGEEKREILSSTHNIDAYSAENNGTNCIERGGYPIGYRLLIGYVWSKTGLNWGTFLVANYVLSIAALLSIITLASFTGGRIAGVAAGFAFAISVPEIFETVAFGRDGMPIWWGIFLALFLSTILPSVRNTSIEKPILRLILIGMIVGFLLLGAINSRSSNIYFIPLTILLIACTYYLNKNFWIKNEELAKGRKFLAIMSIAIALTLFLGQGLINKIASNQLGDNQLGENNAFFHRVYGGLGAFNLNSRAIPNQARFDDALIARQGVEYARRVLNLDLGDVTYLSKNYDSALMQNYLSNLKLYPQTIIDQFSKWFGITLITLQGPLPFFTIKSASSEWASNLNQLFYTSTYFPVLALGGASASPIPGFALLGGIFCMVIKRRYWSVMIIISFALLNALVSGIQTGARHVLMGHFVYYIGIGALFSFFLHSIFLPRYTYAAFKEHHIQIMENADFIKRIAKNSFFIILTLALIYFLIGLYERNAHKSMIAIFKNLPLVEQSTSFEKRGHIAYFKAPMNSALDYVPTMAWVCTPDSNFRGILGDEFEILVREGEGGSERLTYQTKVTLSHNLNTIFIPIYSYLGPVTVELHNNQQCSSVKWVNMSSWKGALWEGAYNDSLL